MSPGAVGGLFEGYAAKTSLHPVPKIANGRTNTRKTLWAVVFFFSLVMTSQQLFYVVSKYLQNDVTVEQMMRFEPIEFPAVTFCSLNPFVKDEAMRVPQISSLANAYDTAIGRLQDEPQNYKKRKKRSLGSSELLDATCYFDVRFKYYAPYDGKSTAALVPCFCVNDQWDYLSYCAPHAKWELESCTESHCHADNYCGAYSDSRTFSTGPDSALCVCNTLRDGCYNFEIIPKLIFEMASTVAPSLETTAALAWITNDGSDLDDATTGGYSEVLLETTETTGEESSPVPTSRFGDGQRTTVDQFRNSSDNRKDTDNEYSFVFQNISDELALRARAKETLVYIGGELDYKTKTSISSQTDFLRMCSFNGKECDMQRDFKLRYDPFYGNCFTFNWEHNNSHVSDRAGALYGLKVMLYADVEQNYIFSSDSPGTRIAFHRKEETPFPEVFGYSAPNGFVSSFALQLKMLHHLPAPYGNCYNFSTASGFLYDGEYTTEGCYRSIYQREVCKRCGCADPRFAPLNGCQFCSSTNMDERTCIDQFSKRFSENAEVIKNNCSQPCINFVYSAMFSCSLYPTPKMKLSGCTPMNNATCLEKFKHNSAVIEIYYQQLNYFTMIEVAAYPFASLLSDVGGTIGLWLGASIVTFIELLALGVELLIYCCQKRCCQNEEQLSGRVGALSDL